MKYSKWVGVFGVCLLVFACYQPWVIIPSKNLVITGMNTAGTTFGKPALMNLFVSVMAAILFLVPSLMAKRANLFFCAFNIAWGFRNFIIVSTCRAGECPEKQAGLYVLILAAVLMMLTAFFQM